MNRIKQHWGPLLVFPAIMGLGLVTHTSLVSQGYDAPLSAILTSLLGMLTIAMVERILPYRDDWNLPEGDVKTDAIHVVVTQLFVTKSLEFVWPLLFMGLTMSLSAAFGPENLWPHDWPVLAQLLLMLLIAEFGRYWVHRAAHEFSFLWRFHAVHHSPNRLYFFNAARFHPIEKIYLLIPEVVPFVLLGTNVECLAIYAVFNSLHGLMQHSNIRIRGGLFNYIFSLTELHRWHHSQNIEESNRNYGNNTQVWQIPLSNRNKNR